LDEPVVEEAPSETIIDVAAVENAQEPSKNTEEPEEFADVPLRQSEQEIYTKMFKLADKDGDGKIGFVSVLMKRPKE
jgi:Ca2+-binding EF-hand superfamily protein